MTLVYILSTYDEYGADDVRVAASRGTATLIFDQLVAEERAARVKGRWTPENIEKSHEADELERRKLAELLAANEPGKHAISDGWGGYQLHIVELEP